MLLLLLLLASAAVVLSTLDNKQVPIETILQLFSEHDKNNDELIQYSEIPSLYKTDHGVPLGNQIKNMTEAFYEADVNGDGVVNFQEFLDSTTIVSDDQGPHATAGHERKLLAARTHEANEANTRRRTDARCPGKAARPGTCCGGNDAGPGEYCHDYSGNKDRCGIHWHCHWWVTYIFGRTCVNNHYPANDCGEIVQCDSESCKVGKYLDSCGGSSKGTCKTCPVCPANHFRKDCIGMSKGKCEVCKGNCGPGYYRKDCAYLNQGTCTACAECPDPAYKRTQCTGTSPGECVECADGYYMSKTSNNCIKLSVAGGPGKDRKGSSVTSCSDETDNIEGICCRREVRV